MNKDEMMKKLQKEGYSVKIEGGIMMIIYQDHFEENLKNLKQIFKENDFNSTFGLRAQKKNEIGEGKQLSFEDIDEEQSYEEEEM